MRVWNGIAALSLMLMSTACATGGQKVAAVASPGGSAVKSAAIKVFPVSAEKGAALPRKGASGTAAKPLASLMLEENWSDQPDGWADDPNQAAVADDAADPADAAEAADAADAADSADAADAMDQAAVEDDAQDADEGDTVDSADTASTDSAQVRMANQEMAVRQARVEMALAHSPSSSSSASAATPGAAANSCGPAGSTAAAPRLSVSADPLKNVFYDVPVEVNEDVRIYLEYFQTRIRPTFARYLIRSGRYIPELKQIFREYNLPEDLVYIALIESGFNQYAYSHARASGPWQFIVGTGKKYGLRQDYWVDERRDVIRSTHAAAKYFTDLYAEFGDWALAMAAYNSGEGAVERALARTGAKTFWELRAAHALPQETRDYVPKFMAAAIIAKSPEEYNFYVDMHAPLAMETVYVDGPTELSAVARAIDVPEEELAFLNPHIRRGITPPNEERYAINVPTGGRNLFAKNFPRIREEEQDQWAQKAAHQNRAMADDEDHSVSTGRHKVRRGETLASIAQKYGTSVARIRGANHMSKRSALRVGKVLRIPSGATAVTSGSAQGGDERQIRHRVRAGESLGAIAQHYKVRVSDLMSWNQLSQSSVIRPGDRLIVRLAGG